MGVIKKIYFNVRDLIEEIRIFQENKTTRDVYTMHVPGILNHIIRYITTSVFKLK